MCKDSELHRGIADNYPHEHRPVFREFPQYMWWGRYDVQYGDTVVNFHRSKMPSADAVLRATIKARNRHDKEAEARYQQLLKRHDMNEMIADFDIEHITVEKEIDPYGF